MSEDLRDKITAAIDRAEQVARAADGGLSFISLDWPRTPAKDALIEHVNIWHPAAVLRRCAADRRVLDLIDSARIKAARIDARERNKPNNASADPEASHELRLYAAALETIVADAWGIEPADEEDE